MAAQLKNNCYDDTSIEMELLTNTPSQVIETKASAEMDLEKIQGIEAKAKNYIKFIRTGLWLEFLYIVFKCFVVIPILMNLYSAAHVQFFSTTHQKSTIEDIDKKFAPPSLKFLEVLDGDTLAVQTAKRKATEDCKNADLTRNIVHFLAYASGAIVWCSITYFFKDNLMAIKNLLK